MLEYHFQESVLHWWEAIGAFSRISADRARPSGSTKSSSKRMSLQDAYCAPRREETSECSRAGITPSSKEENICHIFREDNSCRVFNHYSTLMTGFSHCLSSSQNFLVPSPRLQFPYSLWRSHLQLLTAVLSIWKTVPTKPKISCGATVLTASHKPYVPHQFSRPLPSGNWQPLQR